MRPEALLAGVAIVAILGVVALATLVPGFVADPETTDTEPPAHLDVAETTLAAGDVTAETATLEVTAFVRHRGGPAENVTVVVRATDAESGLVADTTERELGSVADESEREVPVSVTVPREGSYEVTTLLYVDGNRVDAARTTVSGVGALTPPHAQTNIAFQEFFDRPAVEYRVLEASDEVTIEVSSYLTNGGDTPEDDLRLVVTARHADANVVADRAETSVGSIEPGRTATETVEMTVADDHNYYIDAALWRDGVVLETTRAVANLDPEETVAADETRRDVEFEAGEFETDRPDRPPQEPDEDVAEPEGQSGFGPAVTAVALVGSLLAARRWSK